MINGEISLVKLMNVGKMRLRFIDVLGVNLGVK